MLISAEVQERRGSLVSGRVQRERLASRTVCKKRVGGLAEGEVKVGTCRVLTLQEESGLLTAVQLTK